MCSLFSANYLSLTCYSGWYSNFSTYISCQKAWVYVYIFIFPIALCSLYISMTLSLHMKRNLKAFKYFSPDLPYIHVSRSKEVNGSLYLSLYLSPCRRICACECMQPCICLLHADYGTRLMHCKYWLSPSIPLASSVTIRGAGKLFPACIAFHRSSFSRGWNWLYLLAFTWWLFKPSPRPLIA